MNCQVESDNERNPPINIIKGKYEKYKGMITNSMILIGMGDSCPTQIITKEKKDYQSTDIYLKEIN